MISSWLCNTANHGNRPRFVNTDSDLWTQEPNSRLIPSIHQRIFVSCLRGITPAIENWTTCWFLKCLTSSRKYTVIFIDLILMLCECGPLFQVEGEIFLEKPAVPYQSHIQICLIYISMAQCKTAVTPLLTHWSYCSLALSHRFNPHTYPAFDCHISFMTVTYSVIDYPL